MRKHDVRKWLHAVLDLLPVILIPVFMIYSHRHTLTENVEVNYKYQSNEVNSNDDLVIGNIYNLNIHHDSADTFCEENSNLVFELLYVNTYDFSAYQLELDENYILTSVNASNVNVLWKISNSWNGYIDLYFSEDGYIISNLFDMTLDNETFSFNGIVKLLDKEGFKSTAYQKFTYTDYNVIESVETKNTNIMDSFMNSFNENIDKHFNMGNVFNLGGVYQWFNTNIFGGNAPQVIYSIWNIALYELVMDLLFLLYGLFMWFIDMVQKLMEKPLNSVK